MIICCFSPYGVQHCWREKHWFEMIWQIYAGFHSSSHYSSNAEKNKTQIWLCAQKNCGRLQLVWFIISFFPFPKIALLNHKKSANNFVSHFSEFSVLEPRIRPKLSEKSHIPPYWRVKIPTSSHEIAGGVFGRESGGFVLLFSVLAWCFYDEGWYEQSKKLSWCVKPY